jgi:hypothetical protein
MIRDTYSKALVAADVTELQKYRSEKKRDKEMHQLRSDVQSLKECINRIIEKLEKIEANRE